MSDFGLPVVAWQLADNWRQLIEHSRSMTYPLVLKTAAPGIAHKSDCNGVIVGIEDEIELQAAYQDLQKRLGDAVVVMPMVGSGIEVSIGMKNDPQYGPMVIVACGGVLIELLNDRAFRLAPVGENETNAMIDQLKLAKLLAGVRGRAAVDRGSLVELIQRFSAMVCQFRDTIAEIDLNPVIVNENGCTIVDALVIPGNNRNNSV
jgi:hypothetical protein